jgi:DNA-directed RNA polymerase specialized sigma24 family protein
MSPRAAAAWSLDRAAFDGLLTFFGPDPDTAARRYEEVRSRLVKLFAWRGCASPEDLADRTFDRVARRLLEGAQIRVADPYQYCHGVALNVVREHWREPTRGWTSLADSRPDPPAQVPDHAARIASERHLACLECCLRRLPDPQRALLLEYHANDRTIERRQALARSLDIPINALRIRAYRLRSTVEACVVRCAGCHHERRNGSAQIALRGEPGDPCRSLSRTAT